MNALFYIILFILFLYIILRAVRQASSNTVEVCPRCKGEGLLELGGEEISCSRCKGTGQLALGYRGRRSV